MTKPVLSILLLLLYPLATSANPERGRLLYENHCRSCHESNVHIRQTQAAKSLSPSLSPKPSVHRYFNVLRLKVGGLGHYIWEILALGSMRVFSVLPGRCGLPRAL